MSKLILRNKELKNVIYECKDGTQEPLKNRIETYIFGFFAFGLAAGFMIFIIISLFNAPHGASVAAQICENYDGYVASYKMEFLSYTFESLLCRNSYGLIEVFP